MQKHQGSNEEFKIEVGYYVNVYLSSIKVNNQIIYKTHVGKIREIRDGLVKVCGIEEWRQPGTLMPASNEEIIQALMKE